MERRIAWMSLLTLGAVTASLLALGGAPALAATCGGTQGQALLLGCDSNVESSSTYVTSSTAHIGIAVTASAANGWGFYGNANTYGVFGNGGSVGVLGTGPDGVEGATTTSDGNGVYGTTNTGTGVLGESTGTTGLGVYGKTAGSGSAVYGQATGIGTGVYGDTTDGTGVLAHSTNGTALWVNGSAHFSESGIAVVPSGSKSVQVTMGGVTTSSMILATVQQSGGFYVKYAVPSSGSFTVSINKAPASPKTVSVAYFVMS